MKFIRKILEMLKLEYTQNNTQEVPLIISQYSSMPRYYVIDGIKYDIDDPNDIKKIPVFNQIITIDGKKYGMDSVLRKHSYESYTKNKLIYNACQDKLGEYQKAGYYFKTNDEINHDKEYREGQEKRKREELEEINRHNNFKISDMYQFSEIPFEWQWVMQLNHTNGIAWFMLNKNNQYIALKYIKEVDQMIIDSHSYVNGIEQFEIFAEEIDFNYPIPMQKDSIANTYVECIPYTKSGKISKYPVILRFCSSELVKLDNGYEYQNHPYIGEIKILADGNIGTANILFATNHTKFSISLYGRSLIIKRIDSDNGNIYTYNN